MILARYPWRSLYSYLRGKTDGPAQCTLSSRGRQAPPPCDCRGAASGDVGDRLSADIGTQSASIDKSRTRRSRHCVDPHGTGCPCHSGYSTNCGSGHRVACGTVRAANRRNRDYPAHKRRERRDRSLWLRHPQRGCSPAGYRNQCRVSHERRHSTHSGRRGHANGPVGI